MLAAKRQPGENLSRPAVSLNLPFATSLSSIRTLPHAKTSPHRPCQDHRIESQAPEKYRRAATRARRRLAGQSRIVRIRSITAVLRRSDIFKLPPHCRQRSISMSSTRFDDRAQARVPAPCACATRPCPRCRVRGGVGTIAARSLACGSAP